MNLGNKQTRIKTVKQADAEPKMANIPSKYTPEISIENRALQFLVIILLSSIKTASGLYHSDSE
jgi:hypothetical protein